MPLRPYTVEDPIFWLVPLDAQAREAVEFTTKESRVVEWNGQRVFSVGWHVRNTSYQGIPERELAKLGRIWQENDFLFPSHPRSSISRTHITFVYDETVGVFLLRTKSEYTKITSPSNWELSKPFGSARQIAIFPEYDIKFAVGQGIFLATFQIVWNRRSPAEWVPPPGTPVVPDQTITDTQVARVIALRDQHRGVPWAKYRPAVVRPFGRGSYGKISEVIDLHTCRPMIVKEFFRDNLDEPSFNNIARMNETHPKRPYVSFPQPRSSIRITSTFFVDTI